MEWKNYIVGLVDIMGHSDKLDEFDSLWWKLQDSGNLSENEYKRKTELTDETYKKVGHFRQLFTNTFDNMNKSIFNNPNIGTLSPGEQAVMRILANDICKLQSFSDLIVFYAPFDAKDELLTLARVSAMLAASCLSILEFSNGTFFRGGIEIGAGIEFSDGNLYGPVLNNVHRLEKKVANYPRIVIGKRLSDFIQSEGQPVDAEHSTNSALANAKNLCNGLVCQDDGQVIVDYLGEKAVELNRLNMSQYKKACRFVKGGMAKVEGELNEHRKNGNDKLTKRYEKLLAYYQSRMKYWGN